MDRQLIPALINETIRNRTVRIEKLPLIIGVAAVYLIAGKDKRLVCHPFHIRNIFDFLRQTFPVPVYPYGKISKSQTFHLRLYGLPAADIQRQGGKQTHGKDSHQQKNSTNTSLLLSPCRPQQHLTLFHIYSTPCLSYHRKPSSQVASFCSLFLSFP